MNLSTQAYKGARDFYPEEMRQRKWMFGKWREVCEQFGYEEYDGPVLEPIELYTAKTSEEIVNRQTYSFTDRGDRQVVMRPEMTPTVSRMVAARRQELPYPVRLYSISNFFRYEQPQKGRSREFWQLNADLFGIEGIEADFEMILLADSLMKTFGATSEMYEIRVNSRKLLDKRIEAAGLKTDKELKEVIRLIDKRDKLSVETFRQQLAELINSPNDLISYIDKDGATADYEVLNEKLKTHHVDNVAFVGTIARGFDYYTDIVFEVFDKSPDNNRSMFGGGRYDGLVAEFGVEPVPTVGFAVGDITFMDFLKAHQLLPELKNEIDARVILIGDVFDKAQLAVSELRQNGLKLAIEPSGRKIDTQIKNAVKSGVRYVIFIGEQELSSNQFKLRDLKKGEEKSLSLEQIASTLSVRHTG